MCISQFLDTPTCHTVRSICIWRMYICILYVYVYVYIYMCIIYINIYVYCVNAYCIYVYIQLCMYIVIIYTHVYWMHIYISQFFVSCRLQKRFLALHPRSGSSASRWQVSLTPWTLPVKRRGRVASCLTAVIVAAKLGHYSPTLWLGKLMITQYSTEVHK